MPRTGPDGEYTLPPNTNDQQPNTPIRSAMFNTAMDDFEQTLNTPWPAGLLPTIPDDKLPIVPIEKGGTGGETTAEALENLGLDTTVERVEELSDNAVQVDRAQVFTSVQQQQAAENLGLVFRKEYVSAEQTITSGGALSLSHGLSASPKTVNFSLVCKTAEHGYAVGDVIDLGTTGTATSVDDTRGLIAKKNATSIELRFGSNANVFSLLNGSTGSGAAFVNANWRLVVRAWA